MLATLLTIASALGFGVLSAIVPLFNAELYIGAIAAATSTPTAWVSTVAMAVGTAFGKVIIFEASRRGSSRFSADLDKPKKEPTSAFGRWVRRTSEVLLVWLRDPRLGPLTVLVSAVVGIPPLFVVSVLAGVSRQNVYLFALAVLVGRFVRFAAITWPLTAVTLPWG